MHLLGPPTHPNEWGKGLYEVWGLVGKGVRDARAASVLDCGGGVLLGGFGSGGVSMSGLVLSLFPGIGMLDHAFGLEGFTVVRGPDPLWGGDIHTFHPPAGRFDGVIGGPPCQAFSRLRHLVESNGYKLAPNLIPEYVRVVREASPAWWVMENVPDAPEPELDDCRSFIFDNHWLGETPQGRKRRWSSNLVLHAETPALVPLEREPAVCASGGYRAVPVAIGGSGKVKKTAAKNLGYVNARTVADACRLQGLPEDFLDGAPFTQSGKQKVIGNGVPIPMGRAIARAVRKALAQFPTISPSHSNNH